MALKEKDQSVALQDVRRAFIGLGCNLGDDPPATLKAAALRIGLLEGVNTVVLSSTYTSEPAYLEDQPPFSNAVLAIQTTLPAEKLLQALLAVEQEFGRTRTMANGPRTLDCDLLDYEGGVCGTPSLILPHPGILERDFVVTPFLEIAPDHILANGIPLTREHISCGFIKNDPAIKDSAINNPKRNSPVKNNSAALLVCATPIGNLGDVTLRVLAALKAADVIYAEDTRVTRKLLMRYDIHTRIERCDENIAKQKLPQLLERLKAGEEIAYVTDAGVPGISDPGTFLLREVRAAGYKVEVLPGASASVTALITSGFDARSFYFGGFLPRKATARIRYLTELVDTALVDTALVFYESPYRVIASLSAMKEVFPARTVCLARELTKIYEETLFGTPDELINILKKRIAENKPLKGEIVFVVAPGQELNTATSALDKHSNQEIQTRAAELQKQALKRAEIAKILIHEFNIERADAYQIAGINPLRRDQIPPINK